MLLFHRTEVRDCARQIATDIFARHPVFDSAQVDRLEDALQQIYNSAYNQGFEQGLSITERQKQEVERNAFLLEMLDASNKKA